MAEKQKNNKSTKEKIQASTQRGQSETRIYAKKHSDVMGYLYDSELSEIDSMIESANKIVKK